MDTEQILRLASPFLALIFGAIIKYYTEERSKIISYVGHISVFTFPEESNSNIFTHSIIVQNTGKKSAKNVRLGHSILPPSISVYPKVQYSIERNPEGSSEIVIPTLVPKEQVTVSYLYFPPLTWDQINTYTKSDDGLAKIINVIPTPRPAKWALFIAWTLIFIGTSVLFYWAMKLIANFI